MKQACEILVEPIVTGCKKLISSFNPEFQDRLRNNILLAGGGGTMRGLNFRVEQGLADIGGAKVNVVDEPVYAGANGALQLRGRYARRILAAAEVIHIKLRMVSVVFKLQRTKERPGCAQPGFSF